MKVLAKGQCRTGWLWTYVRDDRPFAGIAAPAAAFFYSPDRGGVHPDTHLAAYSGLMQADAYAGFNRLYAAGRQPGPITEAMCWAHARRKFFDVARLSKAPIAIEAVARIDALFEIERDINGKPPPERQRVRAEHSRPFVAELKMWLQAQRAKLSAHSETAKAIAYSLNRRSGLHDPPWLPAVIDLREMLEENGQTFPWHPLVVALLPRISALRESRFYRQGKIPLSAALT